MLPVPVSPLNPGNGNVAGILRKKVVKEVGLLGKDMGHLGTRSFGGVLGAAVHSP